jgi:hypothetical protein
MKELELLRNLLEAARNLDLHRETPDDRLLVMNLKAVRAAIREYDEGMSDGQEA